MPKRCPLILFITSIAAFSLSVTLWTRSHRHEDDLWFTTPRETLLFGLASTNGQFAFTACQVTAPFQLVQHGLHYEQSKPINLHTLGWPVDRDLYFAGFMFRRFRSLMTSPGGVPYVIKWTTFAIPFWFITTTSALLTALTARRAFTPRRQIGFPLILRRLRALLIRSITSPPIIDISAAK